MRCPLPHARRLAWLIISLLIAMTVIGRAASAQPAAATADTALIDLLSQARTAARRGCDATDADRLVQVMCARTLRIGVRTDYPQFAQRTGDTWQGFEIDLARAVAAKLDVAAELVPVTPANRISELAEGQIDVVIATMGYTTGRAPLVQFVNPDYYQSETVVIADRALHIEGWHDLSGKSVCVTVGNNSNWELAENGARLMLYASPQQLLSGLAHDECQIVAQDSSFFARSLSDPGFAKRYAVKLGFAPVPWGMAVAPSGARDLRQALSFILQIFHRDGTLIDFARNNHIAPQFLEQQQALWRGVCATDARRSNPDCDVPPASSDVQPTAFAGQVATGLAWLNTHFSIAIALPMLETQHAWSLFQEGIFNSLVLVAGTIVMTLLVALSVGALGSTRSPLLRWPTRMLVIVLQSSPPIMTLIVAAAVLRGVATFTPLTVMIAAIAVLGLINGANAGQAIAETIATLRQGGTSGTDRVFFRGVCLSAKQIEAFLINAAKGTPVASFIGAPELLNQLTDIGSFASSRTSIYWVMLIFYMLIVAVVVRLSASLRWFLQRQADLV
jgi:ABC-type amino acid transport substrate-binding protein/ABC-type amino acid transport system permease subunit